MERVCDLCGPRSIDEIVAYIKDGQRPAESGYLCPSCTEGVRSCARALADRRDAEIVLLAYAPWPGPQHEVKVLNG